MRKIIVRSLGVGLMTGGFAWLVITAYEKLEAAYEDLSPRKTESFYTESVHEARVFSRECLDRPDSTLDPHQYTFCAWYLTCKWREE